MIIIKRWLKKIGDVFISFLNKREFNTQIFEGFNERAVEYRFVFEQVTRYCPRNVLDVGTGKSALPQLIRNCGPIVTSVDNIHDYWPKGMTNRHYHVIQDNINDTRLKLAQFDMITCISVLEHIIDHKAAIRSMINLLKPGGTLVLTFPYNENRYVQNVYALPGSIGAEIYPFITQVFSRQEVECWCENNPVKLISQEWWRFFDGEFWTLGHPISPPQQTTFDLPHNIGCIVLRKDE